jgi:hypothetical protein
MTFTGKPEAVPPSPEGEGNYAVAVYDEFYRGEVKLQFK